MDIGLHYVIDFYITELVANQLCVNFGRHGTVSCSSITWEEHKPISIKTFGRTPPYLDCNHPVDVSCLSRGDVPSVPRTFCPICVHWHGKQVRTSQMSRDSPPVFPDTSEAYRTPNSFMCVLFIGSFPLKRTQPY